MGGLIANIGPVHALIWVFPAIIGMIAGFFISRRTDSTGTIVLILGVLMWSMFIGLLPIINHAISPDGLAGVFSGQGFAKFLEDAGPQAIFSETRAHRIEVIQSAGIGAVFFGALGLITATMTGNKERHYDE